MAARYQVDILRGYTQDSSGGDTVIMYKQPTSLFGDIEVIPVGTTLAGYGTYENQGRTWTQVYSVTSSSFGWIILKGNTGVEYSKIRRLTNATIITAVKTVGPAPEVDLTNPVLREDIAEGTVVARGNYKKIENTVVTPRKSVDDPVSTAPNDGGFTERHQDSSIAAVIKGGKINNGGVQVFSNYANGELQRNLDVIRENFDLIPSKDLPTLKDHLIKRFNRYKIEFPEYHLTKTFAHVFFTRPNLNLFKRNSSDARHGLVDELIQDPLFYYLMETDKELIKSLTKGFSSSHDLLPYISNLASSFEVSDEFINTMEDGETFTGHKVQYGKHNVQSKTAGTFSINYTDDRNFSMYKLHKAWVEYISRVYRGTIKPERKHILDKILDYACAAYYVLCGPDGESILFWTKIYGVFPTSVPSSVTGWTKGSNIKMPDISINYSYSMKEDFNPLALVELNNNSRGNFKYKKTFVPELGRSGSSFSGNPFVESTVGVDGTYAFKLRFRE